MRLILLAFLVSCSWLPKSNKEKQSAGVFSDLRAKQDLYLSLAAEQLDSYGFASPKCDSLLFSSLAAVAGLKIDILKAEKNPGEWHRHPAFDCYPGESKSSVSKDMFVGLFHYLYKVRGRDALVRIKDYGADHNWVMGEAVDSVTLLSRAVLSANQISILFKMIGLPQLVEGSSDDSIAIKPGFEGHLHVLGIYLSGMVYAGVSNPDLALLKAYHERLPDNALYCAVYHRFSDGVFDSCAASLMNESRFPAESLPSSANYCTDYLWQRMDDAEDVAPCPNKNEVHPGVDFIYAASIILQ